MLNAFILGQAQFLARQRKSLFTKMCRFSRGTVAARALSGAVETDAKVIEDVSQSNTLCPSVRLTLGGSRPA